MGGCGGWYGQQERNVKEQTERRRGKRELMKAIVASLQVGNRNDLGVGSDGDRDDGSARMG